MLVVAVALKALVPEEAPDLYAALRLRRDSHREFVRLYDPFLAAATRKPLPTVQVGIGNGLQLGQAALCAPDEASAPSLWRAPLTPTVIAAGWRPGFRKGNGA